MEESGQMERSVEGPRDQGEHFYQGSKANHLCYELSIWAAAVCMQSASSSCVLFVPLRRHGNGIPKCPTQTRVLECPEKAEARRRGYPRKHAMSESDLTTVTKDDSSQC
uniref:Uncharacterized protein n=1 Tax=Knipowitschia caucasica TaxID=637954 RepID=A0AAV2L967_KNICA